ncbi:scavenger receptor cysteine-rich type 1 protein M130-like [Salminus brasiliensis]|uniref:scavenger receptor cysteine-rich type 1 protein M130-like n=1 Tax=Salminus brasiliensis TaxID=930266 RepID=UPI003B83270B
MCVFSASARLVDGAGVCSGRLEVKLNQSWTTVCEADFDWQGAEVICRELGCGPPLTLQKAHLHTCSTLARKEQNSSLGNAVEITCSGPDDLRLVAGASRCSGTVTIYSGQWRRVNADRWSMREAAVVCRQLDCGSAVASTVTVSSRDEAGWGLHIACVGSESRVRECTVLYSGQVQFLVGVICSDSVRLVDGAGLCSGRLEVKSRQSWTTVCEADFDRQDAEVVCRELSCGPPLTLQGALFGEGQHPFGTKEFQCNGSEKSLLTCSASARRGRSCAPGRRAVGLTCSGRHYTTSQIKEACDILYSVWTVFL